MNNLPQELLELVLMFVLQYTAQTDDRKTVGLMQKVTKLRLVCHRFNDMIMTMTPVVMLPRIVLTLYRGLRNPTVVGWTPKRKSYYVGVSPRGLRLSALVNGFNNEYNVRRLDGTVFRCEYPFPSVVGTLYDLDDGVCLLTNQSNIIYFSPSNDKARWIGGGKTIIDTYYYNQGFLVTRLDDDNEGRYSHYMVTPKAITPIPILDGHNVISYDGIFHTLEGSSLYTYDGISRRLKRVVADIYTLYPDCHNVGDLSRLTFNNARTQEITHVLMTGDGRFEASRYSHQKHFQLNAHGPLWTTSGNGIVQIFYKDSLLATLPYNDDICVTDTAIIRNFETHTTIIPYKHDL